MQLCFTGKPPFGDWLSDIGRHPRIPYLKKAGPEYGIIPLCPAQHLLPRSIFPPVPDQLQNKSTFAAFMMQYFPNNIPATVYLGPSMAIASLKGDAAMFISRVDSFPEGTSFIEKPYSSFSGNGIKVISRAAAQLIVDQGTKDVVISEYVDHERYWVGHFLVLEGKILYRVYFTANMRAPAKRDIKRGPIKDYTVDESPSFDEGVFSDIFQKVSYSGITSIDFTVGTCPPVPIIFEINTRPGGSLIKNTKYFIQMLDALIKDGYGRS